MPKFKAIPTIHPAAIMREQTLLPVVINDLSKSLDAPPEHYNLFPSIEDVQNFKATEFAFDIETSWTDNSDIKMVGLSDRIYHAIVIPFRGAYVNELKRIFRNATSVIGQNCLQFDLPILQQAGIEVNGRCAVWDVMLLQHLCFPDLPHDLEFINSQFTSKPAWKHEKLVFELYNARDVDVTLQCFKTLKPLVESRKLLDLYRDVQVPLARICKLMHDTGFTVDPSRITKIREDLTKKMAETEKLLPEELQSKAVKKTKRILAPPGTVSAKTGKPLKYTTEEYEVREYPWRSSDVVAKYLYETLGLPPVINPKSEEITTGKIALERLAKRYPNPAISALKNLRKWNSLLTLFAKDTLAKAGIQHPHFNVHGTSSGRLSSSNPNLQNIPESARFLYVPSQPGWKIIDVDYSQIENRLTAFLAGDTERLKRWDADPSFSEHKFLAAKFLGIPYEDVVKSSDPESEYIKAKKIVHGTNYGEGAKKIAMLNDLDFQSVRDIQATWKKLIHKTILWQDSTAAEAAKTGYLTTPFGRRRYFYTSNKYTESLSFLPQSTAADILFRAMIALMYERINWPLEAVQRIVNIVEPLPEPCRLLISVHDSLVFECPAEMVDQVVAILKRVMQQPWPALNGFSIPIGIAVGDSWGEAEKIA